MNNLKTLRKQHKKTIEQVIQYIGISKRSYIDYEKGLRNLILHTTSKALKEKIEEKFHI